MNSIILKALGLQTVCDINQRCTSFSVFVHTVVVQVQLFVAGKTTFNMLGNIRINNRQVLLICLEGMLGFIITPSLHSPSYFCLGYKQRMDENIYLIFMCMWNLKRAMLILINKSLRIVMSCVRQQKKKKKNHIYGFTIFLTLYFIIFHQQE